MNAILKSFVIKLLPLIIFYLCFVAILLNGSNYEVIITLTAVIPLVVYIFSKDPKIELILRWVLYIFAIALVVYLISLLMMDYRWFGFCQRNYYAESYWGILKWNQFFIYDLKYLIYIGIIFLALKNKLK